MFPLIISPPHQTAGENGDANAVSNESSDVYDSPASSYESDGDVVKPVGLDDAVLEHIDIVLGVS